MIKMGNPELVFRSCNHSTWKHPDIDTSQVQVDENKTPEYIIFIQFITIEFILLKRFT